MSVKSWKNDPIHFLGFGFGSGAAPFAPGTFGTVAAVPLYLIMSQFSLPIYAVIVVLSFIVGVWICQKVGDDLGVHDHGGIVWDEFVGFWITMFMVPNSWPWVLAGFILFRFFDIVKPWPIKWLDQKVAGGFGVMIDDVLAGVFAAICLHGLLYWFSV